MSLAAALAFLAALAAPQDLLPNGNFDAGTKDWWPLPGTATSSASATRDDQVGRSATGSLRLDDSDPGDNALRMWSTTVPLKKRRPGRLRLSAAVRAQGLGQNSQVQLMAQLWPKEGDCLSYPRTLLVETSCDWTDTDVVFEVPEEAARVRLLFFLKGTGTAWLDDVSLEGTGDAPTHFAAPVPLRNDPAIENFARQASSEMGWLFDGDVARRRALDEGKPVLLYARCTDAKDGVAALTDSLGAPGIPIREDGYCKDLLFRAGPLSTPRISEFVRTHFVPVCAAYALGGSRNGSSTPMGWGAIGGGPDSTLEGRANEGAAAPGCLAAEATGEGPLRMWSQSIEWNGEAAEFVLGAAMKVSGLARNGEVNVMIQCWKGKDALAYARLSPLRKDADWTPGEETFDVPEGTEKVRLLAYLKGVGSARFDDLVLRRTGDDVNLLKNGDVSDLASEGRRLLGFAVDPGTLTTPALCVLNAEGRLVAKLDRQGVLSDELVARWLEAALAAADPTPAKAEDKDRTVAKPNRTLRKATDLLMKGEWERAAKSLASNSKKAGEEGRFLRGIALHRSGRPDEARDLWTGLLSESPWGKKAAACLLDAGPRLHEVMTVRHWPEGEGLFVTTEGAGPAFDRGRSVLRLLELQRGDGSFGAQLGAEGVGWNDAAISAIAVDGLLASRDDVSKRLQKRVDVAIERAGAYLVRYTADQGRARMRSTAFNNPYVLHTLLDLGEKEAVAAMVGHVLAGQEKDGNWTVYGPQRPASFNTAQNTMALMAARAAGLDVPDEHVERGLDALETMRADSGLFPYSSASGHEWMTTNHGAIGRDPLCEHALLLGGRGSAEKLQGALKRFMVHGEELREPTKRLYDYFNSRGHGGYFFFFSHRCALEAARGFAGKDLQEKVEAFVQAEIQAAQEGDGTFVDMFNLGRSYGTAQALVLLGGQ